MNTLFARRLAALVAALLVLAAAPAHAHSQLEAATPAIDAELKLSPRSVSLVFNEPVTVAAKGVQLLDAKGKQIAASGAASSATVKFATPKLAPGRYVLRWRVTSADTHIIVASYAFSVNTPTQKAKPAKFTLTDSTGKAIATVDGNGPGLRSVNVAITGLEGTLELKHPLFGAPMLWNLTPAGSSMNATGMIPAAGTWTVTARVRTGQFDERVVVGKLVIGG